MDLKPLMKEIREAVSEAAWSNGVRLVRAGAVQERSRSDDEVVMSVVSGGRAVALEVQLWPEDGDWGCDCGLDACVHAAAGVIAAVQGVEKVRESGPVQASRPLRAAPKLRYRLVRGQRGLAVRRELLRGDEVSLLTGSIRQVAGLHRTAEDLEVEQVLAAGEPMPAAGWARMLKAWARARSELVLDGAVVKADTTPVLPVAMVRDEGPGFRVSLHRSAEIDETLPGGLARVGDRIRQRSDGGLAAHQRSALAGGLSFGPEEVAKLVGEFLPQLRRHVTVKIKTTRLPDRVESEPPRAELRLREDGEALEVRADIVYGDPAVARVLGGRLELLGGGVPLRDPAHERRLSERIDRALALPLGRARRFEGEEAVRFVRDRLPAFDGTVRGHARRFALRKEPVRIALVEGGGALGLRLESDADPAEIAAAWREGRSLVPLRDGGWAPLPDDFLERHGHLLADLAGVADPDGQLPRHAALLAGELARALEQPTPPQLDALVQVLDDFDGIPDYPLPTGLRAELRPYQLTGYRWLRFLAETGLGGILADDMGLGKTLQALCALRVLGGRSLVVAPTSVLSNWVAEAERFLPGLTVCLYHGPGRQLTDAALVVTSYALMRQDPLISAGEWTTVVLDEAQAIKNPQSQTAQAAFALSAEHRFSLTGTPVENRLDELWSQLHFVMPGFLGGRKDFQARYARAIESGDAAAAGALRRRTKPFLLRRLKQDVARDLPPRTDVVLQCELPPVQREVYDAVRQAARSELLEAAGATRTIQVLEHLLRLRQAACHPRLLPGERPDVSGKLEVLLETLEQVVAEGHKALVFSQWTGLLDLAEEAVGGLGLDSVRLDGATRDRAGVVARFQTDDGPPVFFISLKAGGTGLNLTQADYVFHLDPWWNPAVEAQAIDRAHRIGQTRPVVAVRLIAKDTVEERIQALQQAKRELAEAAIGDEAGLAGRLTREDLVELLM